MFPKKITIIIVSVLISLQLNAQSGLMSNIVGIVVSTDGKAIPFATVRLSEINRGAATNIKGEFVLNAIPYGTYKVQINSLGYAELNLNLQLNKSEYNKQFVLQQKSFALKDVVVTAKKGRENITSSYDINSDAIEHAQVTNLTEIMSLLPGGQTISSNLLSSYSNRIALRSEQNETDNPDFGTAIEVDGIRMGNNATFGTIKGVDLRIIAANNIEKVEVVTGIPSVEYSDFTSGMVKVHTKLGLMPLAIKMSATPRQKQISISKGLQLGEKAGVLNLSYDLTRAISNIASPYTSYLRNAFTFRHKKVFAQNSNTPLTLSSTIAGNIGGYNSKADPDEFKDEYTKINAFNLRGGFDLHWALNSKILSAVDIAANINYTDNKSEEYYYKSAASSVLAFHGTQSGYFVGEKYDENKELAPLQLLERGFWSQTYYIDSKPINYSASLKLSKNFRINNIISNFKLGAKYAGSGNLGQGDYYSNRSHTPTWREHKYSQEPYLNNLGLYAEENLKYKINNNQSITLTVGVRNDYTFVKDARYDNVNASSPRFNLSHTIINNTSNKFLKKLNWYAGWGQAVKLPTFGMLYTRPAYIQRLAFVPGTLADGSTFYAYHIEPSIILSNKNLKWQKNRQFEFGIQAKIKGLKLSLSYFNTLGLDNYITRYNYTPFTYYLTTTTAMDKVKIPYDNRRYSIDNTGTVTVHDDRGILPNEVLDKKEKNVFKSARYTDNGAPTHRQGIEWVLDFGKIKSLYTSLRLDGNYYWYKYINKMTVASWLGDSHLMTNGKPYQYVGYYYGGKQSSNGQLRNRLRANATLITHIPKLRLIISVKLEGTFINSTQNLSEMASGDRSFTIENLQQRFPGDNVGDIYKDRKFTAMYPLYYSSFDNVDKLIPFKEKYIWAYHNDKNLFYDLSQMVITSNRSYYYEPRSYSAYFSANINVSKEIGKRIKLTFYAHNFLNTMAKVHSNQDNINRTLLNSGLVPTFSYGMSLHIKI